MYNGSGKKISLKQREGKIEASPTTVHSAKREMKYAKELFLVCHPQKAYLFHSFIQSKVNLKILLMKIVTLYSR